MVFYHDKLGLRVIDQFERPGARGAHIDLGGGSKLEILDAGRQKNPMTIHDPADDRIHVVIETDDILRDCSKLSLPDPKPTSWGAKVVALRDPDGVSVWLLEWTKS